MPSPNHWTAKEFPTVKIFESYVMFCIHMGLFFILSLFAYPWAGTTLALFTVVFVINLDIWDGEAP